MVQVVEVSHESTYLGKNKAENALNYINQQGFAPIQLYNPDIVNGRWYAVSKGKTSEVDITSERGKMIKAILEALSKFDKITTQRNIYYTIRGMHPDWTYNGKDLKDEYFYRTFTSSLMEDIQILTQRTMQSLGVWAGPRGYIKGDGQIYTKVRGYVPLKAMPALSFDLVDQDVQVSSKARKIIHFEKDAGFEGLASEDNSIMLETMFSTSQGYLTESANKFLADCQKRGMQIYVTHDADPHGLQMQLMYGMSSKNSCYMPSSFYPKPNTTQLLGLFPSIAQALNLPAEEISENSRKIIPNLRTLTNEHPEIEPEIDTLDTENQQWEFQSLNGLGSKAPEVYLAEALRIKGNEIKYVPDAETVKRSIINQVTKETENFVENYLESYTQEWFNKTGGLKDQIKTKLRKILSSEIEAFNTQVSENLAEIEEIDADIFREVVKQKLVDYPIQYWDNAAYSVYSEITNSLTFKITSEPKVEVELDEAALETKTELEEPRQENEEPLTKDDLLESIESRIVPDADERTELVGKIRQAFETVFGEVDVTW